jgi:hypothetical protein
VVNNYSTGCYNCGGWNAGGAWAAGAVGLAAGTAIGATAAAASTAAATSNAYAAGVAAGAAPPPPPPPPTYTIGAIYPRLPGGCAYDPVGSAAYYNCAGYWFSPAYGANGVYYRVVPTP